MGDISKIFSIIRNKTSQNVPEENSMPISTPKYFAPWKKYKKGTFNWTISELSSGILVQNRNIEAFLSIIII